MTERPKAGALGGIMTERPKAGPLGGVVASGA